MLKIFALLVMTIDHADRILLDHSVHWMTVLGRFAFPLFAFMIARNGLYTSNAKQYLKLLILFGVLSQPIYWWALDHDSFWDPLNVLFTLALGLLGVRAWLNGNWWALPFIVAAGWFVEYRFEGVAVMIAIGFTVDSIRNRGLAHPLTIVGGALIALLSCLINTGGYMPSDMLTNDYAPWVITAFALGFITLAPRIEEFEKQFRWPGFRMFFYAYYPGHLAVLGLVALIIFGADV